MRARSALFTLFGDLVRTSGGEAWLTALTEAMAALGFTPQATRTALSRMSADGWVAPRRAGRYASYGLTARGVERLEEAAARIYRREAQPWDGRWRVLVVPAGRDRDGELARTLTWMGFGTLRPGVWISPHDHGASLAGLAGLDGADRFRAHSEPSGQPEREEDRRIVERAWDLRALRDAHADFLATWGKPGEGGEPGDDDPRQAFVARILLVHHWRSFLFLDPGLPEALLPDDWLGFDAAARFRERYEALAPASQRWWTEITAATPAALRHTAEPLA